MFLIQNNKKHNKKHQYRKKNWSMNNKFATVIGINYIGTVNELNGCIKDSKDIKSLLESRYNFKNLAYLTDTEQTKPTDANIKLSIAQLVSTAQSVLETLDEVELVFYYSGHGASIPDKSGDETDRKDETICPLDGGLIVDDDLLKLLVLPLRDLATANPTKTIHLFTMFDSCHSGSILDLNHVYDLSTNQWKSFTRKPINPIVNNFHSVSLSGCQDGEYSTDLGTQGGALTQTVLKILQQKPLSTWKSLIYDLVKSLKSYKQKPLLTTLTPIDLDFAFLNVHNLGSTPTTTQTTQPVRSIEVPVADTIPQSTPTTQEIPAPATQDSQQFVTSTESSSLLPPVTNSVSDFTLTNTNNSSNTTSKKVTSIYKLKFDPSVKFNTFSHLLKSSDNSSQLKFSLNENGLLKIKYSKMSKN